MRSFTRYLPAALALLLAGLAGAPAARAGLDVYYSTTDPGTVKPGVNKDPWSKAAGGTIPATALPAGGSIFIGCRNEAYLDNFKNFTVILRGPGAQDMTAVAHHGWVGTGPSVWESKATDQSETNNPLNTRVFFVTFTPQPDWEVIELQATVATNLNVTASAFSFCNKRHDWDTKFRIENGKFGALGAMANDILMTDVLVFPAGVDVDPSVDPTFSADPQSGVWDFEWVAQTPDGDPRPHGGVRFFTAGRGLATADPFDASFSMLGPADSEYELFAFDADLGEYATLRMVAIPSCQGIDGENVLYVNGDNGSTSGFHILVHTGNPLYFTMLKPAGGGPGRFFVHMNSGFPSGSTHVDLPGGLGRFCFPFLIPPFGQASPVAIWNGIGKTDKIGVSNYFGVSIADPLKAPTTFLGQPVGDAVNLPLGSTWTLQGMIINPAASSPKGVSVTNALELLFLP